MLKIRMLLAVTLLVSAFSASANYSGIYVFGDSLSDNGNLNALDPSVPERFTNGPVAVEVIAATLGFTLTPSFHLLPPEVTLGNFGNNYAIAGAKAIDEDGDETTPDINLPTQVNAFLQIHSGSADPSALYIVLIGGNDIRAARELRSAAVLADTREERKAARQAAKASLTTAVESEIAQIQKLINAGAEHILVVNGPDIGAIPETDVVVAGLTAAAENNKELKKAAKFPHVTSKLSAKFNAKLARKIGRLERQNNIEIIEFDLFDSVNNQISNPEDFGYTNVDDACIYIFSQGGAINPECADDFPAAGGFLFWDEIHPTAAGHQNAAIEILEELLAQ